MSDCSYTDIGRGQGTGSVARLRGTTFDEGIPAIDPAVDQRFRRLTARGNRAFREHRDRVAERLYAAAEREAGRLLDQARRNGGSAVLIAPMALVISAHNRAALLARSGDESRARAVSERVAAHLIAIAESAATPIALRLNCVRHLRFALAALAGPDGTRTVEPMAARVAEIGAEVVRIARIWRSGSPGTTVGGIAAAREPNRRSDLTRPRTSAPD